jgi:hypothetical protein
MTASFNNILNEGDRVLYCRRYGERPVPGVVIRTTKKQARIALVDQDGTIRNPAPEKGPFNREAWVNDLNGHEAIGKTGYSRWSGREVIWPATEEFATVLNERADQAEKEAAEKKSAAEKQRQEYAEEKARKLKEVQDACGSLEGELPPMIKKVMPDGSRLYIASIPVKPCYREWKAGWEEVIVRCKNVEDIDWDQPRDPETGERNVVTKVEAHYTYTNGTSSSFSSVSGSKFDSDEEAVWDAIRDQYHRW